MNPRWCLHLAREDAVRLGRVRLAVGVEVCEDGDQVWLRGDRLDESLELQLRGITGARPFQIVADDQLLAPGARLPKGYLPKGPWTLLTAWIEVTLPPAALAGRLDHRAPLRWKRSTDMQQPSVLVTTIECWQGYATDAPQVRLDRWCFAVGDRGQVVVRGTPLPSIPGERFIEHEGVAVPAGWTWSPPVEAAVLRQVLNLQPNDLALLSPAGSWQLVAADDFVRASRSAVRASAEDFCRGR